MGNRKFEYLQIETASTKLAVFGFSVRLNHIDPQRLNKLYEKIVSYNQFVSFYFDEHHISFIIICENKESNLIDQLWVDEYENIELMSKISLKSYVYGKIDGISRQYSRSMIAIKSLDCSKIDLFQKRINEFSFVNIVYAESLFTNENGSYISVYVTGNDKKDLKRKLSYIGYEIKNIDASASFEKISTRFQKGNPVRYKLGFTGKKIDNDGFLHELFNSIFLNSSINNIKPMKWIKFKPSTSKKTNKDQKSLVKYSHYQKEITKILNSYGWILKLEENNSCEFEYKKLKLKINTNENTINSKKSLKSSSFRLITSSKQIDANGMNFGGNILLEI